MNLFCKKQIEDFQKLLLFDVKILISLFSNAIKKRSFKKYSPSFFFALICLTQSLIQTLNGKLAFVFWFGNTLLGL